MASPTSMREGNTAIEAAQQEAAESGRIDARHMAGRRPQEAEESAVAPVLEVAERVNAPVYVVHQLIPSAVGLVLDARQRGVRAFSESCPHYLTRDDSCCVRGVLADKGSDEIDMGSAARELRARTREPGVTARRQRA